MSATSSPATLANRETAVPPLHAEPAPASAANAKATASLFSRARDALLARRRYSAVNIDLPRAYNSGAETNLLLAQHGQRKVAYSAPKTFALALLAGLFVAWAGLLVVSLAGGVPEKVRAEWPMIPKLITGLFFPGELFTGNNMVLVVALLNRKISALALLRNWALVFAGNMAACVASAYLWGYYSGLYEAHSYATFSAGVADAKARLPFLVALVRAVPANSLVCICIFFGSLARDLTGKILGLYLPIVVFAASGYEHSVANMFFISNGMFHGADVSVEAFCLNIATVSLGNIIGGGVFVGGSTYFMNRIKEAEREEKRCAREEEMRSAKETEKRQHVSVEVVA